LADDFIVHLPAEIFYRRYLINGFKISDLDEEKLSMKIVIVGCGTMGETHAHNLQLMPNVQLAGVFDVNVDVARRVAVRFGTTGYTSFDQMMEETDPDLVCVVVNTTLHKEYVLKAAEYGKHIFCEKPMALNLPDAEEMISFCETKGVKLFIGHVLRFFPNYTDIKTRIDAGEIGNVGVVHTKRVGSHPGKAKAWYNNLQISGGVIMDLMIHDIDYLRWTLGEVKSVYTLNYRNDEIDYALVTLRFENKAIANLEACWGYPDSFNFAIEFAGDQGVIRFDSNDTQSLIIRKRDVENITTNVVAIPQSPSLHDPYYFEMGHFIHCIQEDKEPLITSRDAYKSLEIAHAAIQSALTGLPVHL
jgi:UDP-N-acetylglucosamine 3-dehydrogenase